MGDLTPAPLLGMTLLRVAGWQGADIRHGSCMVTLRSPQALAVAAKKHRTLAARAAMEYQTAPSAATALGRGSTTASVT